MASALSIVKLGLGKISAPSISSISPPRSALERHCAEGYPQWRDSELAKRRWYCTLDFASLTQTGEVVDPAVYPRAYRFALPEDCAKLVRDKQSEWEQAGGFVYSNYANLVVRYHRKNVDESLFPPALVEVVACRVAVECVEYATQSNTKGADAGQKYKEAIAEAGRQNAFILPFQSNETPDDEDTWVTARGG